MKERYILVRDKDLPAVHDLSKRNGLVLLPVSDCLGGFGKDDKVILLALEVNLGLSCVSSHNGGSLSSVSGIDC